MDAYSLGQLLQQARDSRELSLEDVKAKTRIPTHILESFEQGLFQLPELSSVQVRGLLTNYASFLNLDVDQVQAAYADILNPPKRRRRQPPPQPRPATESRRPPTEARRGALPTDVANTADPRRASGEYRRPDTDSNRPQSYANRPRKSRRSGGNLLNILVIFTLALASIAVIVVIVAQLVRQMAENSVTDPLLNTTPGLADLPPTPTFTLAPTRVYARTPTLLPRSTQNYQGEPVLVTISFQQRAWVRVTADGAELYSGLVRPYELSLEYRGINDVVVTSSNAEALIVTYNGQPQPSYGGRGQEVIITFRPNNNITIQGNAGFNPTSEFTATPQDTPVSVAATLLAEQTPSPTDGPSPTPTITPRPSDTAEFTPTSTSTPTATPTITPSFTPSITPTATDTLPPSATPSPTAVVPPRVTPVESTPEKP